MVKRPDPPPMPPPRPDPASNGKPSSLSTPGANGTTKPPRATTKRTGAKPAKVTKKKSAKAKTGKATPPTNPVLEPQVMVPHSAGRPAVMLKDGRRRAYVPNDEDRRKVRAMIGMVHLSVEEVAVVMGVACSTLRLHYADDIAAARIDIKAKGGMSLFRMAMTDGHPDQFKALKFWLQTRARYSTTVQVQVSGEMNVNHDMALLADLRKLSLTELRQLDSIANALDQQASSQNGIGAAVEDGVEDQPGGGPSGD